MVDAERRFSNGTAASTGKKATAAITRSRRRGDAREEDESTTGAGHQCDDCREHESTSSAAGNGDYDKSLDVARDYSDDYYDEEDDPEEDENDRVPLVVRYLQHSGRDFGDEENGEGASERSRARKSKNRPRKLSFAGFVASSAAALALGVCSVLLYGWSSPPNLAAIEMGSALPKQSNHTNSTEIQAPTNPGAAPSSHSTAGNSSSHTDHKRDQLPVQYSCPDVPPGPFEAKMDNLHHSEWYEKRSSHLDAGVGAGGAIRNVTEYLKVFREAEFDNWGHTYDQVKKGMHSWKSKHFVDLLSKKDGNSSGVKTVYESACGIGLNLFMTLEILKESNHHASVSHVVVYGNEYQHHSTVLARTIASSHQFPGQVGLICQADSSNLSFVPSDSFDLVFSGYISPLADPLKLADQFDIDEDEDLYGRYTEYCESKNETVHARAQRAQHYQEEWYARWGSEMIRIAKPGAKIIVEQVSYPLCEAMYDWGGVSQHFWKRAAENYGWKVDVDHFKYQDDTIFRHRYHLMMQKLS